MKVVSKNVKKIHKSKKKSKKRKSNNNNSLGTNLSAKQQLIFSEMSGNCFWNNYYGAFQWRNNYLNFYMKKEEFRPNSQSQNNQRMERVKMMQDCSKDVQKCIRDLNSINIGASGEYNVMEPQNVISSCNEDKYSEDDDDIEVSEEMIEFMQVNIKHKADLEAEKEYFRLLRNTADVTDEVSNRDDVDECKVPNEAIINECRNLEMTNLYGKAAPMIHGMETAIQLTFNWNLDHYKPQYWPILPFSISF